MATTYSLTCITLVYMIWSNASRPFFSTMFHRMDLCQIWQVWYRKWHFLCDQWCQSNSCATLWLLTKSHMHSNSESSFSLTWCYVFWLNILSLCRFLTQYNKQNYITVMFKINLYILAICQFYWCQNFKDMSKSRFR